MRRWATIAWVVYSCVVVIHGVKDYNRFDFPPHFKFGAGTSAYQVEGAAFEDGRTASIYDTFAHSDFVPGDGDIACDEYHRYKEDVQLMVETGLEAYRFSISWSRLIPYGRGPINPKGLEYYNNLIDELIRNGIQPHVTLMHTDSPQVLEDEYQGFLSPNIIEDFTAYADVCFTEFGDRVQHWTTFNEANIFALSGYDVGNGPPIRCSFPFGFINCTAGNSTTEAYIVAHHMILAHASAARLYKEKYQDKQHGFVGINVFAYHFLPVTNTTKDILAAQRSFEFLTGWFMHPFLYGDYPETMKRNVDTRLPRFTKYQSESVKGSLDFVGLNYYTVIFAQHSKLMQEPRDFIADKGADWIFYDNSSAKDPAKVHSYPVLPWGLQGVLEYFKNAYGNLPVYVHENGQVTDYGASLNDTSRVDYIQAHVGAVLDAVRPFATPCHKKRFIIKVRVVTECGNVLKLSIYSWLFCRNGSNTKGYFVWSFLDVFELLFGYEYTYGLYYVDFMDPKLPRFPKLSQKWYSEFLKGKNVTMEEGNQAKIMSTILKNEVKDKYLLILKWLFLFYFYFYYYFFFYTVR